jgi:hydroxymethylpyrimidine pyrophosphatase-like HAD family hydrolase
MKIAFIDLDGTLLQRDGTISAADRLALERAGEAGMVRVAAKVYHPDR